MGLADKVTENDEDTAGKIFKSLLKTGVGMSFVQNSRPASGSEHLIAHLIECIELRDNFIPNFHGEDVGVCTLEMMKYYNMLADKKEINTQEEAVNWDEVYKFYDNMADDVRKLNFPDNIIDNVDIGKLKKLWPQIVEIIHSIPSYEECLLAMKKAGCKTTIEQIGKNEDFFRDCVKFSPYMRKKLTLLRLKDMII